MSKVNIRFVYSGQQEQEPKIVNNMRNTSTNLNSRQQTYVSPPHRETAPNRNNYDNDYRNQPNVFSFERQIPVVPSVQVNSKPTSPKYSQNRLKSPQNIPSQKAFPDELRTKKAERNPNLKSALNIEETSQSQPIKQTPTKKQIPKSQVQLPQGQIVLKSPSFKYIPKQDGELNGGNRKEYVRAEKAEKYLYNGIPQKSEDDFVGCFGCFQRKAQTFKAHH